MQNTEPNHACQSNPSPRSIIYVSEMKLVETFFLRISSSIPQQDFKILQFNSGNFQGYPPLIKKSLLIKKVMMKSNSFMINSLVNFHKNKISLVNWFVRRHINEKRHGRFSMHCIHEQPSCSGGG